MNSLALDDDIDVGLVVELRHEGGVVAAHHGEACRQDLLGQHHDGLGLVGIGGHGGRTDPIWLEVTERLRQLRWLFESHVENTHLVLVLHHRSDAGESDRLGEPEGVLQPQAVVFERCWLYQKNAHVCLPWPVWTCLGVCLQAPSTHGTRVL